MMDQKNYLGVLTGYFLLSFFLAHILIFAQQEEILKAIISTFLSWTGYLIAHYSDTGEIIDGLSENKDYRNIEKLEKEEIKKLEAFLGITFFIFGTGALAYGVGTKMYLLTVSGSFTVIAGYLLTHEGFENVLL